MKNYILITDIGRDTDDTLALIILLYLHKIKKIKLLTIAVSGAKLKNRANCIFYWLSRYSIVDISVVLSLNEEFIFSPIDIDERTNKIVKDIDSNVCILPYDDTNINIIELKKNIKTYDNLTSFFDNNVDNNIDVISIAPVRPLYNCLINNPKIIDKVSNIYFQGNVYYSKNSMIPDIRGGGRGAYNFGNGFPNSEEIQKETKYVIDVFHKRYMRSLDNRLYFLGKNTAYLVEFNQKDLNSIDKDIAELSIKKTLLFAKNLPDIFSMVFKDNIDDKAKKVVIRKNIVHIKDIISDEKSTMNQYISDLNDRINIIDRKNIAKINYLEKEIGTIKKHIDSINKGDEDYYDSCYILFTQFLMDNEDIRNKYTIDFLRTITKISNPYDLVLTYLVIYGNLFNLNKSKFLTKNDNEYIKSKHIQFNEKDKGIFKSKGVKGHMKRMLKRALSKKSKTST